MYVCMCVCMYVCKYLCMYVCVYVSICACIYVCMYVSMYVTLYVYMYVGTYVYVRTCTYMCMNLCTYVCVYACIYTYHHECGHLFTVRTCLLQTVQRPFQSLLLRHGDARIDPVRLPMRHRLRRPETNRPAVDHRPTPDGQYPTVYIVYTSTCLVHTRVN